MTEVVLDASVVWKWFSPASERGMREAAEIRERFLSGEDSITVPSFLSLEIMNIAGRRWLWPEPDLIAIAGRMADLGFDFLDPELGDVARWTARGLSAYDASYVALAEERGTALITADREILRVASDIARPLTK